MDRGSSWGRIRQFGDELYELGICEVCRGKGEQMKCVPQEIMTGKGHVVNGSTNIGSNIKKCILLCY